MQKPLKHWNFSTSIITSVQWSELYSVLQPNNFTYTHQCTDIHTEWSYPLYLPYHNLADNNMSITSIHACVVDYDATGSNIIKCHSELIKQLSIFNYTVLIEMRGQL